MASDGALLQDYVQGSEEAFAELVRRHLDLVYSTARRQVAGDEHLARDISQSVFIDLARKASSISTRPSALRQAVHQASAANLTNPQFRP